MNALWIIDLTESQNAIKAFYDSYWGAFLDNQKDREYPQGKREPWFYVSTPDDLGLKIGTNESAQDIGNKIFQTVRKADNLIDPERGMIKYDFQDQREFNRIFVMLMGDIKAVSTRRFFLPLATSLKVDTQQAQHWNTTPNVYFYGMLFHRKEAGGGTDLTDQEKAFLNQLHNIQNTWHTFEHVMFFEKPEAQREEAINNMALASLHLTWEDAHGNTVLARYSNRTPKPVYLNVGASGIFFEREVQNDREAFLTGHTILDTFVNSMAPEFYNEDAAAARANAIPVFKNGELDEDKLYKRLSAKMPELDTAHFDVKMPVRPGSINIRRVWPRYFDSEDGYIANVKAQLVNNVRLELAIYEHEYLKRLANNQLAWVVEQAKAIEDGIFGVFDDEHPDTYCSMSQAVAVAEKAEALAAKKTKSAENIQLLGDDGLPFSPVAIPERYQKAFDTAVSDKEQTERDILNELDKMLRRHPVFMFSMFSRALLLGFGLLAFILLLNPIIAVIFFLIPIGCYFWSYRRYMNLLKSYQDRFVAVSLFNLNKRLLNEYKRVIHKSQNDVREYCEWNKSKRLTMLRNSLGVLLPKDFHFTPSADFQPLLTDNLEIERKGHVIRVGNNCGNSVRKPSMESGCFDDIPLLSTIPNFDIRLEWSRETKSVTALTNSDKQRLIYNLMKQTAEVPQQLEENLDPAKMVISTAGSVTLMLDVSGSMGGAPLTQLKEAVSELKDKFGDGVRWVAFASCAKMDTEVNHDIDEAYSVCGGGTAYMPALDLLVEARDKGLMELNKLVIISDGCPIDMEQAKQRVLELGCTTDVIYIGQGNQNFLKELAESTGGALQQVQDIQDARIETMVEEGLATSFKLGDAGRFPFGEMLRKSAVRECMIALLVYTKEIMVISTTSIEQMVAEKGNDAGLANWLRNKAQICSMNPGAIPQQVDTLIKSSGIFQEKMFQKLQMVENGLDMRFVEQYQLVTPRNNVGDALYKPDSPDLLLTQLHVQPLNGISDLAWTIDAEHDTQINNEERFDVLFKSYFSFWPNYQFVNIYNKPISYISKCDLS